MLIREFLNKRIVLLGHEISVKHLLLAVVGFVVLSLAVLMKS